MCGIAGLIHRGKSTNVGGEMQKMLQSLKHRGPDSTGYALYGSGKSKDYILRFKVGENVKEGSSAVMEDASVYDARRDEVNNQINEVGGKIIKEEQITPYSFRYVIKCDDDLLELAKKIESVEMTEILSLGQSLELIKDIENLQLSFFYENSWHESWPISLITSKKIPTLIKIEFSKKNKEYSWIIDPNITYALQN